ncbi:unnamed protein product [Rotaria socialis]|uniref:Protein kinase domain-containing protein n=1 Tax=Rotaria socialis TaxID=392032 RepID=A0A818FAV0_9BILA|nr:unnamed protein product [Rotaria socialis]CAF4562638.1 unnamed protein product [Rotaria socialis]
MATNNEDQPQWYNVTCGTCTYTLPVRYQDTVPIGQGAFGAVIRATDKKTGRRVAIKKLLRPFLTKTHAKRSYREVKVLIDLNHPNKQIVQLYDVFTPDERLQDFQTLYFVFNYIPYNMDRVIKRGLPVSDPHTKLIMYSVLRGLKYIHSAGILHRDLKPENVGIDNDSNVTILDFGLARTASDGIQTGYVSTRWWRAPEVYVNWERYDEKLDMWSIGCMMAELILLRPIFRGKDHIDQLNKIFDIIGTPNLETLHELCTAHTYSYISRLAPKPKQNFNQLFGFKYDVTGEKIISGVSPQGVDLLDRLLSFDPRLRPTAEEALAHPYLAEYHDPEDEPTTTRLVDNYQDADLSILEWKTLIWQMIQEFVPPSWINEDVNRTS